MVERLDVGLFRRAAGLQQLLDEIDSPARAVALVVADDIGRTGRGAEAAVNAGAEDFLQTSCVCGSASCWSEKWVCIRIPDELAAGRGRSPHPI